jgi:hypothetical protein
MHRSFYCNLQQVSRYIYRRLGPVAATSQAEKFALYRRGIKGYCTSGKSMENRSGVEM